MTLNGSLIKEHPYATGTAIIVGGLILFMVFSGGSSSGSATTVDTGAAQAAQAGAALSALQLQNQGQENLANIQASVALANIAANSGTNTQGLSVQQQLGLAQLATHLQETQSTNALSGQIAQLQAQLYKNISDTQAASFKQLTDTQFNAAALNTAAGLISTSGGIGSVLSDVGDFLGGLF